LPPTTDGVFLECPRFRVLACGRSGAGKTSLIKQAFGISTLEASHQIPGISDIRAELSTNNDHYVLHDSQGFERGEVRNFDVVKRFVEERTKMPHIKDQLHAIWYCIKIPRTGGRVFEVGDEKFLKLDFKVPVIIVFTQYDLLYNQTEYSMNPAHLEGKKDYEIRSITEEETKKIFQKSCLDPLARVNPKLRWVKVSSHERYKTTYAELIKTTSDLAREHVRNSDWCLSAIPQRLDADRRIKDSITRAMQIMRSSTFAGGPRPPSPVHKHQKDVFSSPNRKPLYLSLETIQHDIIDIWNFDKVLVGEELKRLMEDAGVPNSNPVYSEKTTAGGPPMYERDYVGDQEKESSPVTLLSFVTLVVDLTLVLERLSWIAFRRDIRTVSISEVRLAFEQYDAPGRTLVHRAIHAYFGRSNPMNLAGALAEVKYLIATHRVVKSYEQKKFSILSFVSQRLCIHTSEFENS